MKTAIFDYQIFSQQKFGGISRYFCEIASRIQGQGGWHTRVLAPVYFNEYLADSRLAIHGFYVPAPDRRMERLYDALNKRVSPPLLSRSKADILHQTYYSASVPVFGGRRVVTVFDMIHELYPQYFSEKDLVVSQYKRQAVEAADHVLCISRRTADDLMAILGVSPDKITVTHLGLSPVFEQSTMLPTRSPGPEIRPYFLYVGNRTGYTNFAKVMQAYAASNLLSDGFDVVAFGGRPFARDEIRMLKGLRLRTDAVRQQFGDDETLARVYAGARAFIYPSDYEGFGIPPLEAMASGCPVACSNRSCMPEIVGDAAEYFDPAQAETIRAALETVAFDDVRRNELIAAGKLRYRRFSWRRCADETRSAYEKALGSSRS
jgi:glycosyltransferase involved in cell wall biosynthesis